MYLIDLIFYFAYTSNERYKHENALMFGFFAIVLMIGLNVVVVQLWLIALIDIVNYNIFSDLHFVITFLGLILIAYLSVIRKGRFKNVLDKFNKRAKQKGNRDKAFFIGYIVTSFLMFIILIYIR